MTRTARRELRTIEAAERVCEVLGGLGIETAVIGAMALAVHRYVRSTRDFDLATHADPFSKLREAQRALSRAGFRVELRDPDAEDPLGGLLEVTGPGFKPIQVINFLNPLAPRGSTVGEAAIREAEPGRIEKSAMRVVDLPHLIALKLYAGGPKSRLDVVELLERNQPLDLTPVRKVCKRHGLLKDLETLVAELGL